MVKKIFVLSGIVFGLVSFAQRTHVVVKGDTPYNISKKYGIALDKLYELNPEAKGTLALGAVLKIDNPTSALSSVKSTQSVSKKVGKIILQPKQTIYGITKQYHISETDLRTLNPNLDANMKIGDEVILPSDLIAKYAENKNLVKDENFSSVEIKTSAVKPENIYTVEKKDNYYKISRKFKLTQKELFALNPGLEEKGLQPGDQIIVGEKVNQAALEPVKEKQIEKANVENDSIHKDFSGLNNLNSGDFVTYTVQSGDTVFGILNKFGVTLDQLISLNPSLSGGLKAGMILKIKKLETAYQKTSGDALNVLLMLPFGFDSGDSKYRNLSLDFLTGAKLAIERNVKTGQKLNVKIIDAGSETSFKNSLKQIDIDNTDLIIGPFFKSNVLETLNYVSEKRIPVVAPFANSEDLYDYSNLIIVESNNNVFADRIVKEVKEVFSDQKIYIVADADKTEANYIKSNLEKVLKSPTVSIVNSSSEIELEKNIMTGQPAPIISILANDENAVGARFASKMIELSKEISGNKAFSMFYSSAFEKNTDDLGLSSLVYLMDRKINLEGSFEKEILSDYKEKYCKTPSKYSVIGFDVVNDMLSRENKKGEIFKQINKVQTQLATKFEFVQTKPNGAYQNTGYRVVRLIP